MSSCQHAKLLIEPSRHAAEVGYTPFSPEALFAASLPTRKTANWRNYSNPSTFPAPLVLPGDELSFDPQYEPQPVYDCHGNKNRRVVLPERNTVYVVPVPQIDQSIEFVREWAEPKVITKRLPGSRPKEEDVIDYLAAFYHGVTVKTLTKPELLFMPWDETKQGASTRGRIGLRVGNEVIGIRYRPSKDGFFSGQLNLNDLLDAAIMILPKDGYAVLMLVEHDLYEDEADDFCCGRAYGGSGVSVVSYARYNPLLDQKQEIETEHAWPASHCLQYINDVCAAAEPAKKSRKKGPAEKKQNPGGTKKAGKNSAMYAAVKAFSSVWPPLTEEDLGNLWLGRLCKTASHELGHCFGMDHCVYHACVMQGTSGLTEDAGQPPYLCPVDAAKVFYATFGHNKKTAHADHCTALLEFCERFPNDRMFKAFGEWLKVRLVEIEGEEY